MTTATQFDIETKARMIGDLVTKRIGEPVRVRHDTGHASRKWRVDVSIPKSTLFTCYSLVKMEQSIREALDDKNLNVVVSLGLDGCIEFTVFVN